LVPAARTRSRRPSARSAPADPVWRVHRHAHHPRPQARPSTPSHRPTPTGRLRPPCMVPEKAESRRGERRLSVGVAE
jgi:hypothetical protein